MKSLKGKKLLILGGSKISCEIVNKAKEMGVFTAVTDWYPLEKSPAKQIADEYFMTSTADIEAMVNLIRENNVDGVITGYTDSVLPYYADICKKAGIPSYGTREQLEILTDKTKYKKLCQEFNVPVIEEYDIKEADLETDKINNIKYPVLVKPADGSGAQGVFVCNNKDELKQKYKESLRYSRNKNILVERYLEGTEVTVFYLLDDGDIYLTGMANRHMKHNQEGVIPLPVAYTFPSVHLEKYMKQTDENVKAMFRSLNMKDGMVFMQCIVQGGECVVYDIGYRLTGTLEYKLMEATYGYDPLEMHIRFALTGDMSEKNLHNVIEPIWKQYACNVSFLMKPGSIKEIRGIEEIKQIPGVVDAVVAHGEGDTLTEESIGMLKQIMLRVFAIAEDEQELKNKLDTIYNTLEVISTEGQSLLLEGFNTSDLEGELL